MATHYVAAVHMNGGTLHEHIASMVWMDETTYKSGIGTTAEMVAFIDNKKGVVKVSDGKTAISVGVVHPEKKKPYLRTHKDGKWTDNLLALPRY